MEKEMNLYSTWVSYPLEDKDLVSELQSIENDKDAIFDRFYTDLSFGTAGLRGVIGAGTNRMNIYTVRRATQGMADMLNNKKKGASVAISYDSRIKSDLFAKEAAVVLASNGIKVYLTDRLMPTPVLSFCVRYFNCDAGIMITASHNPSEYNGYKAYGPDGCQMNEKDSEDVLHFAEKTDIFGANCSLSFEKALESKMIEFVADEVYEDYYKKVEGVCIDKDVIKNADLKIVYTPLNGTGREPVLKMFDKMGVKKVSVVKEQEMPDGNFTTCPYPNPEIKEALALGIKKCEDEGADLLVATDPDADRVGIAVRDACGTLVLMSGNAVGVLLLDYLAKRRAEKGSMPKDPIAVKSIVTTALAERVAESYGIKMINVLTGFKYIGEQIRLLEEKGEENRFVMGYEESYGYLSGSFVRDKDAVIGSILIIEMASYYKTLGKSLLDVYGELEAKHGIHHHAVDSFTFKGASGMQKMADIMTALRNAPPKELAGLKTLALSDYKKSVKTDLASGKEEKIDLPSSNVLEFSLENSCSLIVRPSGTEPKIKFYYTVVSDSLENAEKICAALKECAKQIAQ